MTDIVQKLEECPLENLDAWEARDEILNLRAELLRLKDKCNKQAEFLRRVDATRFPDTLFIHALIGERDQNNMPKYLWVVPAYGVDFSYVYENTGKTVGTEW